MGGWVGDDADPVSAHRLAAHRVGRIA